MLYLDDLKYGKLYKKKFFAPIIREHKKTGSAILLLTPNYESSMELIKYPFMINRNKSFRAYYAEKDIMYTINHETGLLECEHDYNIYNKDGVLLESGEAFTETTNVFETQIGLNDEEEYINEMYYRCGDQLIFFNENYDMLNEAKNNVNSKYKMMLYNDRIRNNKYILNHYKQVKADSKGIIDRTFIDLKRYKQLNMWVDLSYYNQVYLRNNKYSMLRSIDMYYEFIRRFIYDKRIDNAGYEKKTVFIPVNGWTLKEDTSVLDFKSNLNPLAVLYRKLRYDFDNLSAIGNIEFIICGDSGYFKFNPSKVDKSSRTMAYNKFERFIKMLQNKEFIDDSDEPDNSKNGIADEIISDLETNHNIVIHDLTGEKHSDDEKEQIKSKLAKNINKSAENSVDKDQALEKLEDKSTDYDESINTKELIMALDDEMEHGPKLTNSRINRIAANNDSFEKKKIKGVTVKDLVETSNKPKELEPVEIPIKTINKEWSQVKSPNFEKEYNLDADIMAILESLSDTDKMYPVSVLDVIIDDTSTSEDYIYTYTVKCEDYSGKRFTLKFDIPKFRDNRFMRLRGNEKIFSVEMPLIPISKTDDDTVQIVSFYNKIFIRRYNTSIGKSTAPAAKLAKALGKYKGKDVVAITGDNSKICIKYDLPIDYIDLASQFNTIKTNNATIYFNQDELRSIIGDKIDATKGIPIGVLNNKEVLYALNTSVANTILSTITNEEFHKLYNEQSKPTKCTYSRASILNTDIPVIVILAYDLGLTKALDMAEIKYYISDKASFKDADIYGGKIKLENGYLYYEDNYVSSMLLNGLNDCDMRSIRIEDLNSKNTWLNQLDNFGGRIKADGLDNFRDLMFDPITKNVCIDYKLPSDYHQALIYSSNLLIDNKFVTHTDISSNRYRTNEVVAAQFYRVLAQSYKEYAMQHKNGRMVPMTMKQSAVIDIILQQNTTSDLSVFQPLLEVETKNMISTKGVTGMNSERAYKVDKRGYDKSMVNSIAQATGFASTVGVNRQTTINPAITGGRGYFKQPDENEINVVNSLCMTEALGPFTVTSDDPFRNDMTFVQTAKHVTPIKYGSPMLVTTGADAALPYLCSDMFAFKAKYNGKVKEITNEYMIVEYSNGSQDYINLANQTMKNSDGGFYINLKLKTDLSKGSSFKKNAILAYDAKSFGKTIAAPQLTYNNGCLCKVGVLTSEDGFEDSGVCSEWLSESMSSDIVVMKHVILEPLTNVYYIAKVGQDVTEGDPMLIFQNAFDEADANFLVKQLNNEDGDVSELGRTVIKSKVTGYISDIKIYRTCEVSELSDSLKKIVTEKENKISRLKRIAAKCGNDVQFDSTDKLPMNGKLKNVDGVLIEIYMTYTDKLSIGDKGVLTNANKCVYKHIYDNADAPYTDFRPNEAIDQITSAASMDGRIITSIMKTGAINKCMIELYRKVADIMGVKWIDLHELRDKSGFNNQS